MKNTAHHKNYITTQSTQSELLKGRQCQYGFEDKSFEIKSKTHILKQVHGTTILTPSKNHSNPSGDGWITDNNEIIAVMTADCTPILVYHPHFVAALHCGWKGTCSGIVDQLIAKISSLKLDWQECEFVLGPAIFPPHYEVSEDLFLKFKNKSDSPILLSYFNQTSEQKWQFDLQGWIASYLLLKGARPNKVECLRVNTYNHIDFASHRREPQNKSRNISWIQRCIN